MKRLALTVCLLLSACGTTKVVREEVPVPYWSPPKNIKQLPPRQPLEASKLTPEQASMDTKAAFQAVAEDLRMLLEENELLRFYYEELVKAIEMKEVDDVE
jgi:hypothetical protein